MPVDKTMNKICSKCDIIKPIIDFYENKSKSTGFEAQCKECTKDRAVIYRKNNKEKITKWKNINKEHISIYNKEYCPKYYTKNKEIRKIKDRSYRQNNKHKINAQCAKRRARKLQATPKWLNKKQLKQIECFYQIAQRLTKCLGIRHEVDHIVPLKGKDICGLHVPWNLQVLPKVINKKKHNKII